MRIYLAARYGRHQELQRWAAILTEWGYEVTSRWIKGDHELRSGGQAETDEWSAVWAAEDIQDLQEADVMISFTEEPWSTPGRARGGRHCEFGAALVWRKRLILVGPREHVFHFMPQVEWYRTVEEMMTALQAARGEHHG